MKMEEAGTTPRYFKQQSTIMMMMIIITTIMVVVQRKSTNNFLAQLLVFNSSPCKVKSSLCFTNQTDMKAHAHELHAFLTGQWSAARSGRYNPVSITQKAGWAPQRVLPFFESILPITANRTIVLLSHNQALHF
jgi:hypothetical protein